MRTCLAFSQLIVLILQALPPQPLPPTIPFTFPSPHSLPLLSAASRQLCVSLCLSALTVWLCDVNVGTYVRIDMEGVSVRVLVRGHLSAM